MRATVAPRARVVVGARADRRENAPTTARRRRRRANDDAATTTRSRGDEETCPTCGASVAATNRARHLALCAPDALDVESWRERDSDIVRASVIRRHGARSRAYETCARRFGWDGRSGGWSKRADDWRVIRREVEAVPSGTTVSLERVREFASTCVLYEDERVTVVAKRAGQPTTPTNRISDCDSCASLVVAYWRMVQTRERNDGELPRGAVVGASLTAHACHRLDLETSGAVAFARTAEEAQRVARAFEEKTVEKTYLALCRRRAGERRGIEPREAFATIDVPLAKISSSSSSAASSSFRVEARPDGKPSVTLWRIIADAGEHALVQCRPKTGRTHQIRAHLAHVGWPIVGDALYASADDGPPDVVIRRHALHAHLLRLDRDARPIRAPVPEDFIRACRAVGVVVDDDETFFDRLAVVPE